MHIYWKRFLLVLISSALSVGLSIPIFIYTSRRLPDGPDLNQKAWEASYRERGMTIPMRGPREGYWGSRISPKISHELLGWRENAISLPGLLEIDVNGIQRYRSNAENPNTILIVGDSVAFGAYASSLKTVYFHQIGTALDEQELGSNIYIFASGGWRSPEELIALQIFSNQIQPDIVVFLNGLNDLTTGMSATSSIANYMASRGGLTIHRQEHIQDYDDRTKQFLMNMHDAATRIRSWGGQVVFVLQPALFTRNTPTEIEKQLLTDTVVTMRLALPQLKRAYEKIRSGLTAEATNPGIHFLDASRLFSDEKFTTFSDMWHFSDYGHAVLARLIVDQLRLIISK